MTFKRMRGKIGSFLSTVLLVLFAQSLLGSAMASERLNGNNIDRTDPYKMMTAVSEQLFSTIKANQSTISHDPEMLRVIVEEELMPYINVRYAGYKVLGRYLKSSSKTERDIFISAFSQYLTLSYAQVLLQYEDQKVEVIKPKSITSSATITSIQVNIIDKSRPTINLVFKLRKNKKTGEWQGFDVVAEGVSLLTTKTSEWSPILRTDGINALTERLQNLSTAQLKAVDGGHVDSNKE
ncbi:phospholipid-binding protein MlaC [Vibrio sp. SS-MA-C1-2]|uniref:phospholipid-binding protein MlaC n=1 Tax=Vibrio sp. SS-MA-C1-2 TaxID=2908646 RepID=UPI001F1C1188|nr:phospholipid-binding protein MlaC [Vibrio sp. SS-MA-C1-2]UJF19592.1 phospholipid-binding protein MlaC [Vibrio sp. SS-MA-C1-2]